MSTIKHALVIAAMAVIIMAFAGCGDDFFGKDEQTTITIVNIPNDYVGKYAYGGLADPSQTNNKKNTNTAVAFHTQIRPVTVAGATTGIVTLDMFLADYKPASVNNQSAFVILLINDTSSGIDNNTREMYLLQVVTPGSNTIDYTKFKNIDETNN
jgi:hypothetical protein